MKKETKGTTYLEGAGPRYLSGETVDLSVKVRSTSQSLMQCKSIHLSDGSACCSRAHGEISRTCVIGFLHEIKRKDG